MGIRLATAPLAVRLKSAGGGAVDNCNPQGPYAFNRKTCPSGRFYFLPPSAAHFSSMSVVTDFGRSRA
jgi:hypothetical protein